MGSRELNKLGWRKQALLEQSHQWRRDFDRDLKPVQVWADKAELGFRLAVQGKDLLMVVAPALACATKGKGGIVKAALSLASNWPVLRAVWQDWRALRDSRP